MGNTITSTQFAVRIANYGKVIEGAQRKAVSDAALMIKRSIEQQTAIATKGSMGYSNMDRNITRSGRSVAAKSKSKLTVGFDVVGDKHPTALLVARGAWGLIEFGSEPHTITPRMESISRKGVGRAAYQRKTVQRRLDIAYGGRGALAGTVPMGGGAGGGGKPVYRVNHKGTKGKRPFQRGVMLVRNIAARRALGQISNVTADILRTKNGNQYTYIRNGGAPQTPFRGSI